MKEQIHICRYIKKSVLPQLKEYLDNKRLMIKEFRECEYEQGKDYVLDIVIVVQPESVGRVVLGPFTCGLVRGWLDAMSPEKD